MRRKGPATPTGGKTYSPNAKGQAKEAVVISQGSQTGLLEEVGLGR